ncbi:MAG TPA: hypothetical protein VM687_13395 [Stenotrophomonas sp.]|nr:hypothetical protein [Stenotrophomonas sp.]
MATVSAAVVIFIWLFDLHKYRDFSEAYCVAEKSRLQVELIGEFSPRYPNERGSPYRLRITTSAHDSEAEDGVLLSGLRLTSTASGRSVILPESKLSRVSTPESNAESLAYLSEPMKLAYQDYRLDGTLIAPQDVSVGGAQFSCALKKRYWFEWRAPWFDALMSV